MIRSVTPITTAATYLKIDPDILSKTILKKTVRYPGQTIEIDHTRAEAISAHHSLIKSIYSRLFDQIVGRLN